MNTPYEHIIGPAKAADASVIAPGSNAAKLSIIAALTGTGLNLTGVILLQEYSSAITAAGIAAMIVVWGGVLGAVAGIIRAWSCPGRKAIPLAAVGLILNGMLLAMGFVKSPIPANLDIGPKNLSAREVETRPVSAQSSRTITTKDWTSGNVIELTDSSFDSVVGGSDIPVLVDFWASWCGPCRMMGPVIEGIAGDYVGKVKVCKLNVDKARKTSAKFGVRSIPTIILFKSGRVQKQWVGVTDQKTITSAIDRIR